MSDISLSLKIDLGVCVGVCSSPSPSPFSSSRITDISSPSFVAFSSSSLRCKDVNFLIEIIAWGRGRSREGLSSFASASSFSSCLKSGSDTFSGFKLPNLPLMR